MIKTWPVALWGAQDPWAGKKWSELHEKREGEAPGTEKTLGKEDAL